MLRSPIIQFGTSRFLQAHADLFLAEAGRQGDALGRVTVVQTSGDAGRAHRLAALPKGFDVHVRGVQGGARIDQRVHVDNIADALSLDRDFDKVVDLIVRDAQVILSNTADAGYRPSPHDSKATYHRAMSYPAKLAHLLYARFKAGMLGLQVMPTELVRNNGRVLRDLVVNVAASIDLAYHDWLLSEVVWVNSLVDRIVSESIEPAGAAAEPYALWAIEDQPGLLMPCRHPAIQLVKDLGQIERRKLFVLNLGHSWMVSIWLAHDRRGATYVRDVMAERAWVAELAALYAQEVLPGFEAADEAQGPSEYIDVTMDRYANPYLDHRLQDIAQNHSDKLQRRLNAFLGWAAEHGDTRAKPRIEAAVKGAKA